MSYHVRETSIPILVLEFISLSGLPAELLEEVGSRAVRLMACYNLVISIAKTLFYCIKITF